MIDNYRLWEIHEAESEADAEHLPKCAQCGEPIYDEDLWDIGGSIYCCESADYLFRRSVSHYVVC